MHQTRNETLNELPIPRKGTKYIARARDHNSSSVTIVSAIRDMLKLARTAKEVEEMIKQKLLKINGRIVEDTRESIRLFNMIDAGKTYRLSLLPTRKFFFEEHSEKEGRLCKVIGKTLVSDGKVQLNLHDGSNIITKDSIKIGDSIYLDFEGKIKKHISVEKGKEVLVIAGKHAGEKGKIDSILENKTMVKVKGKEEPVEVDISRLVVL